MAKTTRAKKGRARRPPAARAAPLRLKSPRATSRRAIEAALAGIAHDLRTPLTGILSLSQLLASSSLGERERGWAEAIKSGAEQLESLTTLIVDAARAEAKGGLILRREPFALRQLTELIGRAFSARAELAGLTALVAIAPDVPEHAVGDPVRLRAALENLADNATKFTPQGRVEMTVSAAPAARNRHRLTVMVRDTGIGLTAAEIKRLFRPFAQASEAIARRYGGAGLGLVFVRRIAEAMGGSLEVESKRGQGSTFRFSVMLDSAVPDKRRRKPAPRSEALRLLCVEDNPYGRVVMNTMLTELGHRVDFVDSGEAAIEAAANGYDAVLMDVTLPGMDGFEASRRIRALKDPRVPVIGVSGRATARDEAAARAAGMIGYLVKPVSPAQLAQALSEVTAGTSDGRSTSSRRR